MKPAPHISVILPTFNEEKLLARCLASISCQDYPKSKVEILVIDDNSTDKTVEIAKKYGAKVHVSGNKNIEMSKSIGVEKAKGKYLMFIDADNELLSNTWFHDAVDLFLKKPELVGVQSYRYAYYKNDDAVNRYCSLMGINDPMAYYLGKRGQMKHSEQQWPYKGALIEETDKFYICNFTVKSLPTVGSQGYMTRKDLIKKTHWKPHLFHLDSAYEIAASGKGMFAFIKTDVRHDYAESISGMLSKLKRNITLYLELQDKRHYKYDLSYGKLVISIVIMITVLIPMIDSIKGFMKKPDSAWFLHPVLSFLVVFLYVYEVLKFKFFSAR